MARRFWEKISNNRLQFYDLPKVTDRDDIEAERDDLLALVALSSSQKALVFGLLPNIGSEEEFDDFFLEQVEELNDVMDILDSDSVTVEDTIDVFDHRWMSPADLAGGAGTIESVCGEEVGNEASQAIDGVAGTNWQHDTDEPHVIVINLGYKKRVDAIRLRLPTSSPGTPFRLTDVDVDVANAVGGLDNPESRVLEGASFTAAGDNDVAFPGGARTGRYVRLTINSTDHPRNHVTVREVELRTRVRTFRS